MQYRTMENIGVKTSLLGFGTMRLPVREDGKIDRERAKAMLDKALSSGINYIDTAYPYHDGESEEFLGEALQSYDRSSYNLATKMPVWNANSLEDGKRIFREQLDKLQTEYIDFYLVHNATGDFFDKMQKLGIVDFLLEQREKGIIKHLGFSFHDTYEQFDRVIHAVKWDFCQVQYNYMDTDIQAGTKGVQLAESMGIPMVIMEPVKGGNLAVLPDQIMDIMKKEDADASPASWALRFVANQQNVKVILSGMSTMEQMEDNLNTFNNYVPITDKELEILANVKDTFSKMVRNGCTGCRYCMPCPVGVDIPNNFRLWNDYGKYGNKFQTTADYFTWGNPDTMADQCVRCGKCEKKCPQHLSIRDDLEKLAAEFEGLKKDIG